MLKSSRIASGRQLLTGLVVLASVVQPALTQGQGASPALTAYRTKPVFVENRGQWDGHFLYKTRAGAMTVFLERTGWIFSIEKYREKAPNPAEPMIDPHRREKELERGVAVRMRFGGGARAAVAIPENRSPGVHNYLLGNDESRWKTDIPLYESVRLSQVWPGIDVVARIEGGHFKYDLLVSPGAELSAVVIEVDGADGLALEADGVLSIETALGRVRQPKPTTWQVLPDGKHQYVDCTYVQVHDRRFGIAAPTWNRELELVVDPGLVFSTYLGGSSYEDMYSLALTSNGSPAVAGQTSSSNYPTTLGTYDSTYNGSFDAFVTKLTPAGNALVFSTYLGGTSTDLASAIVVDGSDSLTIAGQTSSSNFPTSVGAYDATYNGAGDAFITRLFSSGATLSASTYVGGSSTDLANAIAIDAAGSTITVGQTSSSNFPTSIGTYDGTHNGGADGFVLRLSPTMNLLDFSSYLGGTSYDAALSVALDFNGIPIVVGQTQSTNFPTTSGAYDTTYNGANDVFAARVAPTGGALLYSTYVGGSNDDIGYSVAIDAAGDAIVCGSTASSNFPVTAGAYDAAHNGAEDAFVLRLTSTGTALAFSTYVGGSSNDRAFDVALGFDGSPTITGYTQSGSFPTTPGSYDVSHNGNFDAFVAKFAPSGGLLAYSSFLGGSGYEDAFSIAIGNADMATIAGQTTSTGFPASSGAFDTSHNGGDDSFIVRMQMSSIPSLLASFPPVQTAFDGGSFTTQLVGPPGAAVSFLIDLAYVNMPLPPYGTLGVPFPPLLMLDGIGIGGSGAIPTPLALDASGNLFITVPLPPGLYGATFYSQAVAVHPSFPGGIALSTHGVAALPTPAGRASVDPGFAITLVDFAPADANYSDPVLATLGVVGLDLDHSVTVPTFLQQTGPTTLYSAPVSWFKVQSAALATGYGKIEYTVTASSSGTVSGFGAGSAVAITPGTSPEFYDVPGFSGFPDLSALPTGQYTISARLLLSASQSGPFLPTTSILTRAFRIVTADPVVLLHGLCGGAETFGDLATLIENDPVDPRPVRRFLYASTDGIASEGIEGKAAQFATFVSTADLGLFHVAAHSMGGLVARKYFVDNPPSGPDRPRLIMFGTPNFGAAMAHNGVSVGALDGIACPSPYPPFISGCPGDMSTSDVRDELKAGSAFIVNLTSSWPAVAPLLDILNVIGTCDVGGQGDAVVSAAEAYLSPAGSGNGGLINVYVSERHTSCWTTAVLSACTLATPSIASFDMASAYGRPGFILLRNFLSGASAFPVVIPAGASSQPPVGFNRGAMWITPDIAWSGPPVATGVGSSVAISDAGLWVWSGVVSGGALQSLSGTGGLVTLTCPLSSGIPTPGQTDWYVPIPQTCFGFGGSWGLVADVLRPYP